MVGTSLMRLTILALLVAPIVIYVSKFGFHISDCHQRWAEMGSAMSGIYGPILALLTLYILYVQNKAQTKMQRHQLNQDILSKAQSNIQLHLGMLSQILAGNVYEIGNLLTPQQRILAYFKNCTIEELAGDEQKQIAESIHSDYPGLSENWSGIYSHFSGLIRLAGSEYQSEYLTAEFKIRGALSAPVCIALDNYLYALIHGQVSFPYKFSPVLSQR